MRTAACFWKWGSVAVVILSIVGSVSAVCDFSFVDRNKLYNYSLASPIRNFPHGVRSEDGYYKVDANGTILWFQLCEGMIFNHHPPVCYDCMDCGGPSRCGMGCSALVSEKIDGYPVCNTIGCMSHTTIDVIGDEYACWVACRHSPCALGPAVPWALSLGCISSSESALDGICCLALILLPYTLNCVVSHQGYEDNCSLSVSVLCDANKLQGPHSLEKEGKCAYSTVLKHPSGCADVVSVHGNGFGWFGTFMILCICLFGGYLLVGAFYRYYSHGVRGIDVIPHLDLWVSIPHRIQNLFGSLVRKYRGTSDSSHRASYSAVNF